MQFPNARRKILLTALTVLVLLTKCAAASYWLPHSPASQLLPSAGLFHMRIGQNRNHDSCRLNPKQLQISATVTATCYWTRQLHNRVGNLTVKNNSLQISEKTSVRRKALPHCSSAPIQLILISLPFYCWKYKRSPLYLNAMNSNVQYE